MRENRENKTDIIKTLSKCVILFEFGTFLRWNLCEIVMKKAGKAVDESVKKRYSISKLKIGNDYRFVMIGSDE